MLIFPALGDRLIVLASGLVMVLGLAYIVNVLRKRAEEAGGRRDRGRIQ